MPTTANFYSINEARKPASDRVYHNNSACRLGQDIPQSERRNGTNGYRLCDHCNTLNNQHR